MLINRLCRFCGFVGWVEQRETQLERIGRTIGCPNPDGWAMPTLLSKTLKFSGKS